MPAYRHTYRENVLWAFILIGGLVASALSTVILSFALDARGLSYWWLMPGVLPFPISLWIAVRRMRRVARERDARIRELFEADGFLVDIAPSEERRHTVFEPVKFLLPHLWLKDGATNMRWLGLRLPGWLIFEHEFVTGSGRTTSVQTREVAVLSASHPTLPRAKLGDMPWVQLERPILLQRFSLRRQPYVTTLGDAAFDRKWVTQGSVDTARAFLTPQTMRELDASPKGETWLIGHGYVCCAYRGALSPEQLRIMVKRMAHLME